MNSLPIIDTAPLSVVVNRGDMMARCYNHPAKYPAATCAEFLRSRFADNAYRREKEAM